MNPTWFLFDSMRVVNESPSLSPPVEHQNEQ